MLTLKEIFLQDEDRKSGTVCFRNTRVPVSILFEYLGANRMDAFFIGYPNVTQEQVTTVLAASKEFALSVDQCPYGYAVGTAQRIKAYQDSLAQLINAGIANLKISCRYRNPRHDLKVVQDSPLGPTMHQSGTLMHGPHIYGNAYDATPVIGVWDACKTLKWNYQDAPNHWIDVWGAWSGGKRTAANEGNHIHIGF